MQGTLPCRVYYVLFDMRVLGNVCAFSFGTGGNKPVFLLTYTGFAAVQSCAQRQDLALCVCATFKAA